MSLSKEEKTYLLYANRQAASPFCANVVPGASTPETVPGGKPVMAVPGHVPPFPTPLLPVMAVAPVLVRVVAPSAPKDLARPRTTGRARLSRAGCSAAGAARERDVRQSARTASLFMLTAVDFMMNVSGIWLWKDWERVEGAFKKRRCR
jgi:hypothetical protein